MLSPLYNIPGDFRKEDLAAAVVQLICDEGGQLAFHMARNCNVKHVIACGSFFNHPMTWRRLAGSFLKEALGMRDAVRSVYSSELCSPCACARALVYF